MSINLKLPSSHCVSRGQPDLDRQLKSILTRTVRYPLSEEQLTKEQGVVDILYDKGWANLEGLLSDKLDLIDTIKDKLDYFLDKGGDECKYGLLKGSNSPQSEVRDKELFMAVANPLYRVPEIAEILFLDKLVDIAKGFYKCMPAVGTLNLRKSFANNLPPDQTNFFHCDKNCPFLLKFFIYLNDVDTIDDGPFTYVEGSAYEKPNNWTQSHRWPDEAIKECYGDRIKHLTAKKGDVLTATTTGFHKGQKVVSRDRGLLTLNFVACQEDFSATSQMDIKKETFLSLPEEKKPLTDFLYVVE